MDKRERRTKRSEGLRKQRLTLHSQPQGLEGVHAYVLRVKYTLSKKHSKSVTITDIRPCTSIMTQTPSDNTVTLRSPLYSNKKEAAV